MLLHQKKITSSSDAWGAGPVGVWGCESGLWIRDRSGTFGYVLVRVVPSVLLGPTSEFCIMAGLLPVRVWLLLELSLWYPVPDPLLRRESDPWLNLRGSICCTPPVMDELSLVASFRGSCCFTCTFGATFCWLVALMRLRGNVDLLGPLFHLDSNLRRGSITVVGDETVDSPPVLGLESSVLWLMLIPWLKSVSSCGSAPPVTVGRLMRIPWFVSISSFRYSCSLCWVTSCCSARTWSWSMLVYYNTGVPITFFRKILTFNEMFSSRQPCQDVKDFQCSREWICPHLQGVAGSLVEPQLITWCPTLCCV